MPRRAKVAAPSESLPPIRPAIGQEARELQLTALAYDLVEQRLRDGTASSQETVHFLRLGSMREKLEREKLESEVKVANAKVAALEAQARNDELFKQALQAFTRYSGQDTGEDYRHEGLF